MTVMKKTFLNTTQRPLQYWELLVLALLLTLAFYQKVRHH